jgi:hypothetical protein
MTAHAQEYTVFSGGRVFMEHFKHEHVAAACCLNLMIGELRHEKVVGPDWVNDIFEESERTHMGIRSLLSTYDNKRVIALVPQLQDFMSSIGGEKTEYRIVDNAKKHRFRVSLRLFFNHTNPAESAPSKKELNAYMKDGCPTRYEDYVEYLCLQYNEYADITFSNDNVISFVITTYNTSDELFTKLLDNALEDVMYESAPGNGAIYPCRKDPEEALGSIDYRRRENITIKKVA